MVFRVDRRKLTSKVSRGKGKAGASGGKGAVQGAGKGSSEGRVDRFERLGRILGGGGPSEIISARGPGERATVPLTAWEEHDIKTDPYFREVSLRAKAYRDLPDPWKKKVDEWGRKVGNEMKYSLAKAIMKG